MCKKKMTLVFKNHKEFCLGFKSVVDPMVIKFKALDSIPSTIKITTK